LSINTTLSKLNNGFFTKNAEPNKPLSSAVKPINKTGLDKGRFLSKEANSKSPAVPEALSSAP
jgi:hypothetical protein